MTNKYIKYGAVLILSGIILWLIFSMGGSGSTWSKLEKQKFLNECEQIYYSELTCQCILTCVDKKIDTYEQAMQQIVTKSVPFSIEECVNKCE